MVATVVADPVLPSYLSSSLRDSPRSDISWSHHGDGACGEDGGHGARLQLQIYFTWGGNFRVSRLATCLTSWFMLSTLSLTAVTMPGSRRLVASSWRDLLHWTRHQQASRQTGLHLRWSPCSPPPRRTTPRQARGWQIWGTDHLHPVSWIQHVPLLLLVVSPVEQVLINRAARWLEMSVRNYRCQQCGKL